MVNLTAQETPNPTKEDWVEWESVKDHPIHLLKTSKKDILQIKCNII